MKRIMAVFGTRPEAIKMCPLILELRRRVGIEIFVCLSGQHAEMTRSVLEEFGVEADADLAIMKKGQTLFHVTESVLVGVGEVIRRYSPDLVLVHGDTSTAFSAALAAFYSGIPVGHVEAGLRSNNMHEPFPEEFNRRAISLISKYNFAPTETAAMNLSAEGVAGASVFVVGNTVVDAVKYSMASGCTSKLIALASNVPCALLTAHRRENLGDTMREMLMGVREALDKIGDLHLIYPVHPNPDVRAVAHEIMEGHPRIIMTEPLGMREMHCLIARCRFIMTDSGGIQEEGVSLGKRVLVMRRVTERPEGIGAGLMTLAGTDREKIRHEMLRAYSEISSAVANTEELMNGNPFGDGSASEKIADIILRI